MAIVLEIRDRVRPAQAHRIAFASVPLALGRAPANDIPLPDPEVSSAHAQIVYRAGQPAPGEPPALALIDLGSANGTRVAGDTIATRNAVPLSHGDVISIGRYDILLQIDAAPAPPTARTAEVTARSLARGQLAGGASPTRYLRVDGGPEDGRRLSLDRPGEELVLGRAPEAALRVADPSLPARAARLRVDETTVTLEALGTEAAGIARIRRPASTPRRLQDGESLQLGGVRFTFVDRSEALLGQMARPHAVDALRPMGETQGRGVIGARWRQRLAPALDAAAAVLGGAAVTAALVMIAWAVGL